MRKDVPNKTILAGTITFNLNKIFNKNKCICSGKSNKFLASDEYIKIVFQCLNDVDCVSLKILLI